MGRLHARVLRLEGGPRRSVCLTCEFEALNREGQESLHLSSDLRCTHPPTTLWRELAALNRLNRDAGHDH